LIAPVGLSHVTRRHWSEKWLGLPIRRLWLIPKYRRHPLGNGAIAAEPSSRQQEIDNRIDELRSGRGAALRLSSLNKSFGPTTVVRDLSLDVAPGEFLTLLGPSGSGKSTTLMMIAGLIEPSGGEIYIDGHAVTPLPPKRRNIGVVFQSYALFPHLSVAENIAFPLRMRGRSEAEIRGRIGRILELVRLTGFGERFPTELSGGQQQRVALARALVFDPPVLLLDEPLGALDRQLRESMQRELKGLHRELGVTIVHVTHDQAEALAISDRIGLMMNGHVVQIGSPSELYEMPANGFVADFLGEANFLFGVARDASDGTLLIETSSGLTFQAARVDRISPGQRVRMMIRPERVVFHPPSTIPNRFDATIEDTIYAGEIIRYRMALSSSEWVTVATQNRGDQRQDFQPGASVVIGWRTEDGRIFTD
jgi:putative spermidine/putrescine transport system ATP-binding protein